MDAASWALRAVGLLPIAVDALVWGIAAHLLFRWCGAPEERWLAGGVLAGVVFVAWDHVIFAQLVGLAGLPVVAGDARSPERLLEMGVGLLVAVAGFRTGKAILTAVAGRSGSAPDR